MLNRVAGKRDMAKALLTLALGLTILAVFIVAFGGHRFWEDLNSYYIRFASVKNLSVGRPVKYAGLEIGRVLAIDVDKSSPSVIHVEVGIDAEFVVHKGTVATISQKGIVGDNFVLLTIYGEAGPLLGPESYIPSAPSNDFLDAAESMAKLSTQLLPHLTEIATNIAELLRSDNRKEIEKMLQNTNTLLQHTDVSLQQLTKEFLTVTKETRAGMKEARTFIRELRTDTGAALKNFDSAVTGLHQQSTATLEVVREQVETLGVSLTALSTQLQSDLDYDQQQIEEILENTVELTDNLKLLSRSLKERPWQVIYRPDDSAGE